MLESHKASNLSHCVFRRHLLRGRICLTIWNLPRTLQNKSTEFKWESPFFMSPQLSKYQMIHSVLLFVWLFRDT